MAWVGKWDGGRVWEDEAGKRRYFIRRKVNGRRYEKATGATTLRGAMEQLKRFEGDPEGYSPQGDERREPLPLDEELSKDFLAWSLNVKGNTRAWVSRQKTTLAFWAGHLRGVDLRRMSLRDHVLPAVEGVDRARRIRVLKAFLAWLRKERHVLTAAEDVTYGTLSAPQARPEQWKRDKVIPREHLDLALKHLDAPWRDVLLLQNYTGWHVTEAVRFAEGGAVEPLPPEVKDEGSSAVAVCPRTKAGAMLRARVTPGGQACAERLLAHGPFSEKTYRDNIKRACKAAGIPPFTPGRSRHTVATWGIDHGANPAGVAAFLGHASPSTTRRFYATYAAPARVPTPAAESESRSIEATRAATSRAGKRR